MVMIEKELNIKNITDKGIKENIKTVFSCKKDIESTFDTVKNYYSFFYVDKIKNMPISLKVDVYLSLHEDNKKFKAKIENESIIKFEITTDNEDISSYDLELYYFRSIYEKMTTDYLQDNTVKYTVRVYYKMLHDLGFKGEYVLNWKNKIRFKPLLNEKQKNTIGERIISVDCEVYAKSLDHARSQAINITKEFISYLSLLIDMGFYEMHSKFTHIVTKTENYLREEYQRHAFIDNELSLVVMDNMNGLRHINDYAPYEMPSFFSLHKLNENNIDIDGSYIKNSDNNNHLEKTFLQELTICKSQVNNDYREDINCSPHYSLELLIPRQIRNYYKGILSLTDEKAHYFRNACRLYNISQTCGAYEPTLMLAYMVSSVECLAKSENVSFSKFAEFYLENEYNKDICDFLYGHLRSGHFHSGELFFTEYNVNLDISLEPNYLFITNIFHQSKFILRKILVNWIQKNILI